MTVSQQVALEIARLYETEHWRIGTIVSQLGVHEDVVRRVLGLLAPNKAPSARPARKVDPFIDFIGQTLAQYPRLRATRLYDMLCERGYTGSVRTLRRYVAAVRPQPKRQAYLRVETLIAQQAQVDWAHVAKVNVCGGQRSLWLFVMVLAWSRAMWAEFVFDTTVHSLLRSLDRACAFFGGSCRQWLFDNPKTVVLERYGDAVRFHPLLLDLAGHYHAQLRVCTPYKANQKGRVERIIRYIRERFLAGRIIASIEQGNRDIGVFIDKIANQRPHPTQQGKSVAHCFAEEQQRLLALPQKETSTDLVKPVSVDKTAFVRFDCNIYSVPPEYASQTLTLVADDVHVRLLHGANQVAQHPRCWGRRQKVSDPQHHEQLRKQKRGARESTARDRLRDTIPHIDRLFENWVAAGRNVGSMTARVVRLLDLYGHALLTEAVGQAISRGTSDPGALAQLCEQYRTRNQSPVPIDIAFGDHVLDRDVIPHALENYDGPKDR